MTAEVAILNKQAVALAADSAVTTAGRFGQKIFNTVNKLFTLSKYHPVGIMVYSSAEVMSVPIETVIKVFRERLGKQAFPTLQTYHDHFLEFLKTDTMLFPEAARMQHCEQVISSNLFELRDKIMREISHEFPGWGEPTLKQAKARAQIRLGEYHAHILTSPLLPGSSAQKKQALKTQVQGIIGWWQTQFQSEFGLTKSDLKLIAELSLELLLREIPTGLETGFVIAGFGEEEPFPQLCSFEFEFSVLDIHKWTKGGDFDASQGPVIVPFAQPDMIETFMLGRARYLDSFLLKLIDDYFIAEKVRVAQDPNLQGNSAPIHSLLDVINNDLRTQFQRGLDRFTQEYHVQPVMETVENLPKEELAVMAESLISLTSIKRRMSPDAETVGGPTDVAVISKGDGFVWIKRKHYFQPELNPGFSHNYYRKEEIR